MSLVVAIAYALLIVYLSLILFYAEKYFEPIGFLLLVYSVSKMVLG